MPCILLLRAPPPNRSFIWLAVSRSANPANLNPANWCFYRISGRRNVGTDLESWADYPSIGAGADALVVTTNQFTFAQGFFTFAIIRAINKQVLSNNAGGRPASVTVRQRSTPRARSRRRARGVL